ncbi:MAG: polysaccharide lyase [Pseudomonadota bacterium]
MFRFALLFLTASPAFAGEKGEFARFVRSLNETPHGYEVMADPTGAAPSAKVERFEVRAGDCAANGGWDDCAKDRERSELAERGNLSRNGDEDWYGFSVYLPEDWPDVWPTKTTIAQWHQERSHPVWMLLHRQGDLVLDNQSKGRSSEYVTLVSGAELRGRWIEVEAFVRWSTGDDGVFRLFIDGEEKVSRTGPTMTAEEVYFKYGVYRSFISRHGHPVPTQIALFASVRKAKKREGLHGG